MQTQEITYDLSLLEGSRAAWERSSGLRQIYQALYRAMLEQARPETTLEIGSGIGVGKTFWPGLITSDIVKTPYVDRATSAYAIEPDGDRLWGNIIAIDVLHHLMKPFDFFESAASVLQEGGRIIMVEPAATFGGRLFYSLFHHEPINRKLIQPPFEFSENGPDGEFANMGMALGLFESNRAAVDSALDKLGLRCVSLVYRDTFAYPCTGGYSKPQLLPTRLLKCLLSFERCLPQIFYQCFGLRVMIVLEKL